MTKTTETNRYQARPLALRDLPAVAGWFEQVKDLSLFDRRQPVPVSGDTLKATWRKDITGPDPRSNYWFAIDDASGAAVGLSGLLEINYINGDAILPVFINDYTRQKGVGIRMGALMLDLAFDQLRLSRVSTYFRSDNKASRRLVKQWGFREEGRIRKAWFVEGKQFDIIAIGLLRREWQSQRAKLQKSLSNDVVVRLGYRNKALSWPPSKQNTPRKGRLTAKESHANQRRAR